MSIWRSMLLDLIIIFIYIPFIVSNVSPTNTPTLYSNKSCCPYPFENSVNGEGCYLVLYEKTSWEFANATCHSLGGYLAQVNSSYEQQDLVATLNSDPDVCRDDLYLGLLGDDETWIWSDGSVVQYGNWTDPDEADDDDCGYIMPNGGWNIADCSTALGFVCEADPVGVAPCVEEPPRCPSNFSSSYDGHHCYHFSGNETSDMKTYSDVKNMCNSLGGYVASLNDIFELFSFAFARSGYSKGCGISNRYIGLTGSGPFGSRVWVWDDGSSALYWEYEAGKDCVVFTPNGELQLAVCSDEYIYACESELWSDSTLSPSSVPSVVPTGCPSGEPSTMPTSTPSTIPSCSPSSSPPTGFPTAQPSGEPSPVPTWCPSGEPSTMPTSVPSCLPSSLPSCSPSSNPPTGFPTAQPSGEPSPVPTWCPSGEPSTMPTSTPSTIPSCSPSSSPPTGFPTAQPSGEPSPVPTWCPSGEPSTMPTSVPSCLPSSLPSCSPSSSPPTGFPTAQPSGEPSPVPTWCPSGEPSTMPTSVPSCLPSSLPSCSPSSSPPTGFPTAQPSGEPSPVPTWCPSGEPSTMPTSVPSCLPSSLPSCSPSSSPPTGFPTAQPSGEPSPVPTWCPSGEPSTMPSTAPVHSPLVISVYPTATPSTTHFSILSLSASANRENITVMSILSRPCILVCQAFEEGTYPQFVNELVFNGVASANAGVVNDVVVSGLRPSTRYGVFCTLKSPTGESILNSSVVMAQHLNVKTTCCVHIYAELVSQELYSSEDNINVLKFIPPTVVKGKISIHLFTNFTSTVGSTSIANPFLPPSLVIDTTTAGFAVFHSLPASLPNGVYNLRFNISGDSASDFEIVYGQGANYFTMSSAADVPGPNVSGVVFSQYGSYLMVTFNAPTDKAGLSSTFSCSRLLEFSNSDNTRCRWQSSSAVRISSAAVLGVQIGDRVSLLPGKIRARCPSTVEESVCQSWPTSVGQSLVVSAPRYLVSPNVVVSAPSVIGQCNNFVLDLSSSTGGGGRQWRNVSIRVNSPNVSVNTSELNYFYANEYAVDEVTPAPFSMFSADHTYVLEIVLCNFLGACSEPYIHSVVASSNETPVVSVYGKVSRRTKKSKELKVYAHAYNELCDSTISSRNLIFSWTMYDEHNNNTFLKSQDKIASTYRLAPYSFQNTGDYRLVLSVTNVISEVSKTAVVYVSVIPGNIVAVLYGGNYQSLNFGESLRLDASSSYDEDVSSGGSVPSSLSFLWKCKLIIPLDPSFCGLRFSSANTSTILVYSDDAQYENSTSEITVTVYDNNRFDEAVVHVAVLPLRSPTVRILASEARVASNKKLTLRANVELYTTTHVLWSVDDAGVDIAVAALSPYDMILPAGFHHMNLVLSPYTLPLASTLQFTLSSSSSKAIISVVVADAPSPGEFTISPSYGLALTQNHLWAASKFTDSELPLTYSFAYFTETGSRMVVQSRSESSYTTSLLPPGVPSKQFVLTCFVEVYNDLDASSRQYVDVTSSSRGDDYVELSALIETHLVEGSYESNTDATKETVSWGTVSLNSNNCSTNCSSLHRRSCEMGTMSCGVCQDGYIGDETNRDSVCISVLSISHGLLSSVEGAPCNVSSDCGHFDDCINERCYTIQKGCPLNCSRRGDCSMIHIATNVLVDSCSVKDSTCAPVCECDAGFSGKYCSVSAAELALKREIRIDLATAVVDLAKREYLSEENMESLVDIISELGRSGDELTNRTCDNLMDASDYLLDAFDGRGSEFEVLLGLSEVLSHCVGIYSEYGPLDSIDNATSIILKTTNVVFEKAVLGEAPVRLLEDSYRQYINVQPLQSSENMTLYVPQSDLEVALGHEVTSVSAQISSTARSAVGVALSEFKAHLYLNASSLVANPIKFYTSDFDSLEGHLKFNFTTFLPENATYVSGQNVSYTTNCSSKNIERQRMYTCPSGEIITHVCDGKNMSFTSYCPVSNFSVFCGVASGMTLEKSPLCQVESFSSTHVVCSCALRSGTGRRQLESIFDRDTGVEVAAMSEFIALDFRDTIVTIDDISAKDLERSIAVLVMFGVMWISVQVAVVLVTVIDTREPTPQNTMTTVSSVEHRRSRCSRISRIHQTDVNEGNSSILRKYVRDHFNAIFPLIFRQEGKSWLSFFNEIAKHHRYVRMFTASGPDSDKTRVRIGIQMLTIQSMLMFILAVFYDLQYPSDDGTCKEYNNEDDCLDEISMFDGDVHKCNWLSDESKCEYRTVKLTITTVIIIGSLMAMVASPINVLIDFLFDEIISAPTADDSKSIKAISEARNDAVKTVKRVISKTYSNIVAAPKRFSGFGDYIRKKLVVQETRRVSVAMIQSHSLASIAMRRALSGGLMNVMPDGKNSRHVSFVTTSGAVGDNCDDETYSYDDFVSLLTAQHNKLRGDSRRRFDRCWMLESATGTFQSYPRSSLYEKQSVSMHTFLKKEFRDVSRLAHRKIQKLKYAADVQSMCSRSCLSNSKLLVQLGLKCVSSLFWTIWAGDSRLTYLNSISSKLGHRTTPEARIFEYKSDEEYGSSMVVTSFSKRIAWFLVVIINIFFIIFTLLRTIDRDRSWQGGYITACIIQMLVEIILYETMECTWINFTVPSLVRDDVKEAVEALYRSIDMAFSEKTPSNLVVDVPQFLFVSTQIARHFPTLFESGIVLSYHTYLGGRIAERIREDVFKSSWNTSTAIRYYLNRFLTSITVVGIMKSIGTAPVPVQRLIVHIVQPALLTGLFLLITLMITNPWVSIVVAAYILFQIGMYAVWFRTKQKKSVNKFVTIRSSDSSDVIHEPVESDREDVVSEHSSRSPRGAELSLDIQTPPRNDMCLESTPDADTFESVAGISQEVVLGSDSCALSVDDSDQKSGYNERNSRQLLCLESFMSEADISKEENFSDRARPQNKGVGPSRGSRLLSLDSFDDSTLYQPTQVKCAPSWSFNRQQSSCDEIDISVRQVLPTEIRNANSVSSPQSHNKVKR